MGKLVIVLIVLAIIVIFLIAWILIGYLAMKIGEFRVDDALFGVEGVSVESERDKMLSEADKKRREEELELEERRNWKPRRDRVFISCPDSVIKK